MELSVRFWKFEKPAFEQLNDHYNISCITVQFNTWNDGTVATLVVSTQARRKVVKHLAVCEHFQGKETPCTLPTYYEAFCCRVK